MVIHQDETKKTTDSQLMVILYFFVTTSCDHFNACSNFRVKFQRSNPSPCQVPKISAYAIKTRAPAEILIISTIVVLYSVVFFFPVFFGKIENPNVGPSEGTTSFENINAKLNQHAKNTSGGVA